MTKKEKFIDWMKNIDKRDISTRNLYSSQIDLITNSLRDTREIENDIYSINNSNEMDEIINIFFSNSDRKSQNAVGHNLKSASLKKYKKFLQFIERIEKQEYDLYVNENNIDKEIGKIEDNLNTIEITEKLSIIKSRIGQSEYRNGLLKKYKKCQLCDIDVDELLVASHIKPWNKSTNKEKLDLNNGLLLCCNHDKLFDIGFISFNASGEIIISNKIIGLSYKDLNITKNDNINVNNKTKKYLEWHLENIFIK
jgi:predicted restriction endonuclease